MAILILGGAGYIGSHTVWEMAESGMDVAVADNLATGHRSALHPKARFYAGDLRERAFLDEVFERERIDGVIHFAAYSVVGESMLHPLKYYNNNLCGTETLLEAMLAHGVRDLVFSSSASVYGEPEAVPIPETAPTRPTNCYGETKLAVERMLEWTARSCGLRYVALRYFNACGAHPCGRIGEAHDPETHLIPLILQVPLGQRERAVIFGDDYPTPDGTCVRDYVHVMDLSQGHRKALEYLARGGESGVFNLGSGAGCSVRQVIETAARVTGRPIPTAVLPRRPGDPACLVASSEKARRVLGWQPAYDSLEQMIATAWNWMNRSPAGDPGK